MRGHKKGVHKVETKTKKGRKLHTVGGFKAMEHKKERKVKVSRKRHPRRKRA